MVQERIYNYFERNPQLHVLFIFDKMNIISTELKDAEWRDDYIYKLFDGAWFNVKYAIDECREYHERLQVVAEQAIAFDFDDGVVVNYAKFGDVC